MDAHAAKAILLLLVLALPSAAYAQNPYSDAAFRTFISVSTNGTQVTARLTFLNLTYFSQVDEKAIDDVYRKVDGTRNINDLYQPGSYSTDNFTAEIMPVNNTALRFTFEGQIVTDASGDETFCSPKMTDEKGIASCDMQYYKDGVDGTIRSLEDYKSCGYATVTSDENFDLRLPSASQTATVCPKGGNAITSFGPSIYTVISARLPFCFPAMLIAGLLVAAMYYSGRDPLSLFDITTPKLPKTQTFKVKMGQSPQMLRQVQRRYLMIKKQARRDSVREIARLAKKAGMGSGEIAEAKRNMNAFYDAFESRMKKGKLAESDIAEFKTRLANLLKTYERVDANRFDRSLAVTSGLLMAYLQSHQAYAAMGEGRGKAGKGWWTRNVSQRAIDGLTNASLGFENSRVGMVLGRIPFVKKVVATPSKVLDVTSQLRGSRNSLKAIRSEMLGQMATMLGRTSVGKPVYSTFKRMHVTSDGKETRFGKAYTFMTGRNWKVFEDKHDLTKKRLVDYHRVIDSIRQHAIDSHNRMFDELASKLLNSLSIRANSLKELAKAAGMSEKEIAKLGATGALDNIFAKLKEKLMAGGKDGEAVAREMKSLMAMAAGDGFDKQCRKINEMINKLAEKEAQKSTGAFLEQLKSSATMEMALNNAVRKLGDHKDQGKFLTELSDLAKKNGKNAGHIDEAIGHFKAAEELLRKNAMVYMKDGYYQIVEKHHLMEDIRSGMTERELEKKYGKDAAGLIGSPGIYKGIVDAHASASGKELRNTIAALMGMTGLGLSDADKKLLGQLSAQYGDKRSFSTRDVEKIKSQLDQMKSLKDAENRIFAKFDAKEKEMKTWVLGGGEEKLFDRYKKIVEIFDRRLAALKGVNIEDILREGCSFGKNPLELIIDRAFREAMIENAKLNGIAAKDAERLADQMAAKMGHFKDMDSLEQFFNKKAGGKAHDAEFAEMLRRLSNGGKPLDSELLYRAAMVHVNEFAREWAVRNFAVGEIMHNGSKSGKYMASFANARNDLLNYGKVKSNLAYLGGEKEFYRQEMGYADYRTSGLEGAIFTARGWEKLFGYAVSNKMQGTSRGEQVLHLLNAARDEYASTLKRYEALYKNLMDKTSVFYDAKFAEKKGAAFDVDAYDAIMQRGYTWQDKKNGLELLMNVDRKSTPMLEYNSKYMDKSKGQTEIVKKAEFNGGKADIRDYAPLLARTMGSYYSSREVGFVVLLKRGDKWVYGDPFLDKGAQAAHQSAEKQVTMRKEILAEFLKMKDGYQPGEATLRVISTKDFMTYAKDRNYGDFFGSLNKMDRARESLRSAFYKPGMLYGEFVYGAYNDRINKMQAWYTAQWQMRQTLDRIKHDVRDDGGMMGGKERFKYDEGRIDSIYEMKGMPTVKADDTVRNALKGEMEKLSKGDGTYVDGAKAWWHNWRGRVASEIIGEIGSAESKFYNAKLEMRALDRIYENGELGKGKAGKAKYEELRSEMSARNKALRSDYKQIKNEYMGLNRDIIGWVGSAGTGMTYAPQRTIWNFGIVSKMLDSHFVQGTQDAFYNITESSVMRDPRVAIGASAPGWDHSYYVGYHTGQNVYERARFWATNSLWEQQMRFHTDVVYTVHKWWNDRMSFFARYTSGYPAPVKSDMMYAPHYEARKTSDYFKALFVIMPFQPRTYSDYFRARWQDAITFSGAGSLLASYQSLGNVSRYDTPEVGQEKRSWLRRQIDKYGAESDHYFGTPYRISSQQRYIDQIMNFETYVDKNGDKVGVNIAGEGKMSLNEARDGLKQAIAKMDADAEERYKHGISDAIGKVANINDRRGRYVRDVFSGSDIQEDGSRNRFLDMYSVFHSNVFSPTIPGMLQASPIGKGEWHSFPQVARMVDEAEEKTRLGAMKHYWRAGYERDDEGRGRISFSDQFSTKQDAVAEAYRNDVPVLMHLMKMQSKEIGYSLINSPSLAYINPVWFGLGRKIYKTAISHAPGMDAFTSTFQPPDWTPAPVKWWDTYQKRKRGEIPRETLDGDTRHQIYGIKARAVVDDAEKTNDYFRWMRDGVYGFKFKTAPGWRKTSKEASEDRLGTLLGK